MVDLGGVRDIEYIRKGMSELSVIQVIFLRLPIWRKDDLNRPGIGHSVKPRSLHTPCGEIFHGEISYVYFIPCFFPDNNSLQIAEIRSKHGLILDCSLQLTNTHFTSTTIELVTQWARSFHQGKRYGFLHETGQDVDPRTGGLHLLRRERNQPILDVKAWLEDAVKCDFDGSS